MSSSPALHVVDDPRRGHEFRRIADGAYRLTLSREGFQFDVTRLRWAERGELLGLLTVTCELAGAITPVDRTLSVGTFNLTSVSARSARAKDLQVAARAPEVDIRSMLEELCQCTLKAEQTGTPIQLLRNVEPLPADQDETIAIHGIPVPLRHAIVLSAHGGTGKSIILLSLAGELEKRGISTLILDWETDQYTSRRILGQLFPDNLPDVKYRRCERPLAIEVESIAQQIDECGIQYVGCDSAGYASDGRPEDAEVALRYFRALRQLRVGSTTLAHISSGEHGTEKPFGSVFWHNSARATWYLERDKSSDSDEIVIAAQNKKNNLGRLLSPIGLAIRFEPSRTSIEPTNLAEHAEHAAKLPLAQRLRHALRTGPKTLDVLAEELDASPQTIERYLRVRNGRPSMFTKVPSSDGVSRIALVERRYA